MRINSTTKSYINTLIDDKAKPALDKLIAEGESLVAEQTATFDKVYPKYKKELDDLEKKVCKEISAIMEKYGICRETNWRGNIVDPDVNFYHCDSKKLVKYNDEINKNTKKTEAMREKIERAKTEVVAKLSLGGDVGTLEDLISNLKF